MDAKRKEAFIKAIKGFVTEKEDVKIEIKYADDVIKRKENQKSGVIY